MYFQLMRTMDVVINGICIYIKQLPVVCSVNFSHLKEKDAKLKVRDNMINTSELIANDLFFIVSKY